MKNYLLLLSCAISGLSQSQNIGVNTTNPQQVLDVNGAIRVGTTNTALPGSIRFNSNTFEGYSNGRWEQLGIPTGSHILSEIYDDPAFLNRGFAYAGNIEMPFKTYVTSSPDIFTANSWYNIYYQGIPGKLSFIDDNLSNDLVWMDTVCVGWNYYTKQLVKYNPSYDNWSVLATLGSVPPFSTGRLFYWNKKLYLVTGQQYNAGFIYDVPTATHTPLPDMPVSYNAKDNFASALLGGNYIILYGGTNDGVQSNDGVVYSLATNSWTNMNTIAAPSVRTEMTVEGLDQKFVVWGGLSYPAGTTLNNGRVYDVITNTWATINPSGAPSARYRHTITMYDFDKVFVYGGRPGVLSTSAFNDWYTYNFTTGTWTGSGSYSNTSNYYNRSHHSAVSNGNQVFIYGGAPHNNPLGAHDNGFIVSLPGFAVAQDISPGLYWISGKRTNHKALLGGNKVFFSGGNAGSQPPPNYNSKEWFFYNISAEFETHNGFVIPSISNRIFHLYRKQP